jgi:hypothetical protein
VRISTLLSVRMELQLSRSGTASLSLFLSLNINLIACIDIVIPRCAKMQQEYSVHELYVTVSELSNKRIEFHKTRNFANTPCVTVNAQIVVPEILTTLQGSFLIFQN